MNKKLSTIVNDFRKLKESKKLYTHDQYVQELEKLKGTLIEMINNTDDISRSDEEYLQAILLSLSIKN